MLSTHKLAKRAGAIIIASIFTLVMLATSAQSAFAGFSCPIDPTAILSDGTHVKMKTSVETDPSNVSLAHYLVHGPVGTSLDKVIYSGPHRVEDTVEFVADNPDGVYSVDTLIYASVSATVETTVQVRNENTTVNGVTNVPFSGSVTP